MLYNDPWYNFRGMSGLFGVGSTTPSNLQPFIDKQVSNYTSRLNSSNNKIAPVVASALIGVGASGLGSLFNYFSQSSTNKQNQRNYNNYLSWLRQSQQMTQNYNTQMWQMNNQWNSPANQMSLLRQAGLNPNLVYGGFSGNASQPTSQNIQASAPPQHQAPQMSGLDFGQVTSALIQDKELNQQKKLIDSQAKLNEAEAGLKNKELGVFDEKFEKWKQTWKAELDKIQADTDLVTQTIDYYCELTNKTKEEAYSIFLENLFNETTFDTRCQLLAEELNIKQQTVKYLVAQEMLARAQAESIQLDNKITKMYIDNGYAKADMHNAYVVNYYAARNSRLTSDSVDKAAKAEADKLQAEADMRKFTLVVEGVTSIIDAGFSAFSRFGAGYHNVKSSGNRVTKTSKRKKIKTDKF